MNGWVEGTAVGVWGAAGWQWGMAQWGGSGTGCGDQPGGRRTGRGGSDLVAALSNAFSASVEMVL